MHSQRGNILFLILLAVVLFAALSYAVTQSTRGGGNNATSETVRAQAADLLQFFSQIDAAVLRMRTVGGIPIEKISFEVPSKSYGGTYYTGFANPQCSNDTCKLFKPAGGGATPRSFENYATKDPTGTTAGSTAPGYMDVHMFQWPYAGTNANDIVIGIQSLTPDLCAELAKMLDITPPTATGTWVNANDPANWDNSAIGISTPAVLLGKDTYAGAVSGTGTGRSCTLRHLVIAR